MDSGKRVLFKDALIIFVLLIIAYGFFFQTRGWNEKSRFSLIFALVEERNLQIDNYYNEPATSTGDVAFYNGHYYSDKAIGPVLIGVVVYFPIYLIRQALNFPDLNITMALLTFLVVSLPSAVAGSLMYVFCYNLSGKRYKAFLVTIAITLGTLYYPFSISFFNHQLTSSILFFAFLLIFYLKEKHEYKKRTGYFYAIGFLLGFALICEYPAAISIFFLMLYLISIVREDQRYQYPRNYMAVISGLLIPILLQLLYNKLCFDGFFTTGYSYYINQEMYSGMHSGLMGFALPSIKNMFYMTFHPTMGLFWQSPVLILAFLGAKVFQRNSKLQNEAILSIAIFLTTIVVISGYWDWYGGWSLGPRHLVPMLPLFCIFLTFIPDRFDWLLGVFSFISIGQMLIAVATDIQAPNVDLIENRYPGFFEYSNIYSYCLPRLIDNNLNPNLMSVVFGTNSWINLIPLLVFIVLMTVVFFRREAGNFWNSGKTASNS